MFENEGTKMGMLITRPGAPAIGIDIEELIYPEGNIFILVGGAGVLNF